MLDVSSILNIIIEVNAQLPAQGKAIFFPGPKAVGLIQTPDYWLREAGEKYWLEMMMHGKFCKIQCLRQKKLSKVTITCTRLYTTGELANIKTRACHTTKPAETQQTTCYSVPKLTSLLSAELTRYKPTFMARGAKCFPPVAPCKTGMHIRGLARTHQENLTSCVIHQKTKPEPRSRKGHA